MPYALIPLALNLVAIPVYWVARTRNNLKLVAVIQPATTLLSIAIVVLGLPGPANLPGFSIWILIGMALALIGDINNVNMADDRTLMRGLVLFLLAYLVYATALSVYNGFHPQDLVVAVVLLVLYAAQMAYLWPGLGAWKVPVLAYGLLMPFLVSRAISTFFGGAFTFPQSLLLSLGAVMVYLGDLEIGIERFRRPLHLKFGPLLYAGGQLLVALSTILTFS